eukprot:scaffold236517_cov22-Tisochrysis_lutea.AAC.1
MRAAVRACCQQCCGHSKGSQATVVRHSEGCSEGPLPTVLQAQSVRAGRHTGVWKSDGSSREPSAHDAVALVSAALERCTPVWNAGMACRSVSAIVSAGMVGWSSEFRSAEHRHRSSSTTVLQARKNNVTCTGISPSAVLQARMTYDVETGTETFATCCATASFGTFLACPSI